MKRLVIYLLFLSSLMFFSSGIFAVGESCGVYDASQCSTTSSPYLLMKLSDATNAHGATRSDTIYQKAICCDFSGASVSCSGTNKVLGLSATTNAHAEIPTLTAYTTPICYADLECVSVSNVCDANHPVEILSLSATTNAHIGAFADYPTKICCSVPTPVCELQNAYWSFNNVNPTPITSTGSALIGQPVYLVVDGTAACGELDVSFTILENDAVDDDPVTTNPASVKFIGSRAMATWTAEYQDDPLDGDPEYKFTATTTLPLADGGNTLSLSSGTGNKLLIVREETLDEYRLRNLIYTCSDIPDENYCTMADIFDVAEDSVPTGTDCSDPLTNCGCDWNPDATGDKCDAIVELSSDEFVLDDGGISPGETCDGDNFGDLTCSDFDDFSQGGGLSCVGGQIDTSLCGGGTTGICGGGDNIINKGEQCEGTLAAGDWGGITGCSDFGFSSTEGTLTCGADCKFDTSQCTGGFRAVLGRCVIDATENDDDCADGSITYSWTGSWTGAGTRPSSCPENGGQTLVCPAEVQLPFFGFYNFVIAFAFVMAIYFVLGLMSKKKVRRTQRNGKK